MLASVCSGVKPVVIELTDTKTKKVVDELEVDACMVATGRAPYTEGLNLGAIGAETDRRGYVPVSDKMEVLDKNGKVRIVRLQAVCFNYIMDEMIVLEYK